MKRHGNLFEKIVSKENIELAFEKARKGKNWQDDVKEVVKDKEKKLAELRQSLIDGTFKTSKYRVKTIFEPKKREIYILPFYPDRIVQHAVMNVIAPILDAMFINDSYACRKGKGQHAGSKRCMQFVRRNEWVYQFDISKFYPSIWHKCLFDMLQHKIKCRRTLALLKDIIESIGGEKNVPIGNYTSQWFGNYYMNEVDQYLKHECHVRDYIRYCDDFLVFGNDKEELKAIADKVAVVVEEKLGMKFSKRELYPTSHGVDYLGYRHFPDGKILVRKSTAKRIKKRIKEIPWKLKHGQMQKEQAIGKIASAHGWLKHANTHNFKTAIAFDKVKAEVEAMQ